MGSLPRHWKVPIRSAILARPIALTAATGLGLVVISECVPQSTLQIIISSVGWLCLLVASMFLTFLPLPSYTGIGERDSGRAPARKGDGWVLLALVALSGLIGETWFHTGKLVAGGDISPVIGDAWIHNLFRFDGSNGATFGLPVSNETKLPLAVVESVAGHMGLGPGTAEQVWYTVLFIGILGGMFVLCRSMRIGVMASASASIAYFFSPYTLSKVDLYPNFLAAMAVTPVLMALILLYASRKLHAVALIFGFIIAGPLIGFEFTNPPLVIVTAGGCALAVIIAGSLFGRTEMRRAAQGLAHGTGAAILASLYWLAPAIVSTTTTPVGKLAALSSWSWTEIRYTLTNAFWLNTMWAWNLFPHSYPFSHLYDIPPLWLVRLVVPAMSFGVLVLAALGKVESKRSRTVAAIAMVCLVVEILANGTMPPFGLGFRALLHLPGSVLLREPNRFLMLADLGYAILLGLGLDSLRELRLVAHARRKRQRLPPGAWAILVSAVLIAGSFPLLTGSIVPTASYGYPSSRIVIPPYWMKMADYVNRNVPTGNRVLVLPLDDYYQMPYSWYYGADDFVEGLFRPNVINPMPGGYATAPPTLVSLIGEFESSILSKNFAVANGLLRLLDVREILVRTDVISKWTGRHIANARILSQNLGEDHSLKLLTHIGRLWLFRRIGTSSLEGAAIATVNSAEPSTGLLDAVTGKWSLVSHHQIRGMMSFREIGLLHTWTDVDGHPSTTVSLRDGWRYEIVDLTNLDRPVGTMVKISADRNERTTYRVVLTRRAWFENVPSPAGWNVNDPGNCYNAVSAPKGSIFAHQSALPGNGYTIGLGASVDSACVWTKLDWRNGSFIFGLRSKSSNSSVNPRVCFWELPLFKCAVTPAIPASRGWHDTKFLVHPDPGTKNILLYLYADAGYPGVTVREWYSRITVTSVESTPEFAIIGYPFRPNHSSVLVTAHSSYSDMWRANVPGAIHVKLDGLYNSWILPSSEDRMNFHATFEPTRQLRIVAAVLFLLSLCLLGAPVGRKAVQFIRSSGR